MLENSSCMEDIVRFISKNVNVIVEDNSFYLGEVNLTQIIEGTRKESDREYTTENIISNFLECYKCGYIISNINTLDLSQKTSFTDCVVTDVTPLGHKFIKAK